MPSYPVDHVVRYGSHPEQIADVRLARRRPSRAVVLLVHGGFWRQEYDRHHADPVAAALTDEGMTVASVEYRRLGGSGGWPATFDDIAAAVDTLPVLVPPTTHDAQRVVLLGHSAGGHLVLWAAGRHHLPATSGWHLPEPPALQGIVALAPVADLAMADRFGLDDDAVAELLDGHLIERPERYAQCDPSTPLPPAARTVIVHGSEDRHVPIALSHRYVESVLAAGADVTLDVITGGEHFAVIEPGSAAWPRVLAALDAVLTR